MTNTDLEHTADRAADTESKTIIEIAKEAGITDSPVDLYEGMTDREIYRIRYENKFNLVIYGVFDHISQFYDNVEIEEARDRLDEIVVECPDGPICCFLKYIYREEEYRTNLLGMKEKFFVDTLESGELDPSIQQDRQIVENIFKFKNTWDTFASDTKLFIMRSLRGLVKICEVYIRYL